MTNQYVYDTCHLLRLDAERYDRGCGKGKVGKGGRCVQASQNHAGRNTAIALGSLAAAGAVGAGIGIPLMMRGKKKSSVNRYEDLETKPKALQQYAKKYQNQRLTEKGKKEREKRREERRENPVGRDESPSAQATRIRRAETNTPEKRAGSFKQSAQQRATRRANQSGKYTKKISSVQTSNDSVYTVFDACYLIRLDRGCPQGQVMRNGACVPKTNQGGVNAGHVLGGAAALGAVGAAGYFGGTRRGRRQLGQAASAVGKQVYKAGVAGHNMGENVGGAIGKGIQGASSFVGKQGAKLGIAGKNMQEKNKNLNPPKPKV